MATKQDKLYFGVRKVNGKEWIDISSWGYVFQTTKEYLKNTDRNIPHWAKDNPVIRISRFKLVEIVE